MSYSLFLDDERKVSDVLWMDLPAVDWVIVRNYAEFVKTVTERGIPARVSFDHDLAEEHYAQGMMNDFQSFDYAACEAETGYHCAVWLGRLCEERKVNFPEYYVHSLNPVGRRNIQSHVAGLTVY